MTEGPRIRHDDGVYRPLSQSNPEEPDTLTYDRMLEMMGLRTMLNYLQTVNTDMEQPLCDAIIRQMQADEANYFEVLNCSLYDAQKHRLMTLFYWGSNS